MTITKEIQEHFDVGGQFTMSDVYDLVTNTQKKHSIRARIYEGVEKGLFEKVARGVYTLLTKDNESIALIQGDGRDLSMIPDCSIDCIITDHPYFDEKSNKGGNRDFATYSSFKYSLGDFKEKARVLKDGAFMVEFFAEENSNNYDYIYSCKKMAEEAGLLYYSKVDWKKGDFVSNTGRKAKNTEQMIFFTKGEPRKLKLDAKKNKALALDNELDIKGLSSYDVANLLDVNNLEISRMKGSAMMLPTVFDVPNVEKKDRVHQAEKPIELFKQLLEYITLKGEVVLDQFAGSCNLGIACLESGRSSILIEKDKETYVSAKKRLTEMFA